MRIITLLVFSFVIPTLVGAQPITQNRECQPLEEFEKILQEMRTFKGQVKGVCSDGGNEKLSTKGAEFLASNARLQANMKSDSTFPPKAQKNHQNIEKAFLEIDIALSRCAPKDRPQFREKYNEYSVLVQEVLPGIYIQQPEMARKSQIGLKNMNRLQSELMAENMKCHLEEHIIKEEGFNKESIEDFEEQPKNPNAKTDEQTLPLSINNVGGAQVADGTQKTSPGSPKNAQSRQKAAQEKPAESTNWFFNLLSGNLLTQGLADLLQANSSEKSSEFISTNPLDKPGGQNDIHQVIANESLRNDLISFEETFQRQKEASLQQFEMIAQADDARKENDKRMHQLSSQQLHSQCEMMKEIAEFCKRQRKSIHCWKETANEAPECEGDWFTYLSD